ncbi:hypothetical protein BO78DRAFT_387809 [Aspergillus sclerotiicarbonarius CBS 121057]|uniref:Uncharacterized protein n=1 Tax=Aspergillus sclerotiicarbonarius (strain CBS 121057 / IBT 28362) TaxID=1448318 RepID=A0A319E5V1_ASPSB|nr:hypothetical protein BO78DRAFT_387809 [Aspergillus sclerotiicarbonarius CBS 121057]
MPDRFSLAIATILAFMLTAASQIAYNPKTNSLICSKPGGSYCVYGSLEGSTIISCYESTPPTGDAVCAFNGTGYTLSMSKVPVPESILCDETDLWKHYPNTPDEPIALDEENGPPQQPDSSSEPTSASTDWDGPKLPIPPLFPATRLPITSMSASSPVSSHLINSTPSSTPIIQKRARVCSDPWAIPPSSQWLGPTPSVSPESVGLMTKKPGTVVTSRRSLSTYTSTIYVGRSSVTTIVSVSATEVDKSHSESGGTLSTWDIKTSQTSANDSGVKAVETSGWDLVWVVVVGFGVGFVFGG